MRLQIYVRAFKAIPRLTLVKPRNLFQIRFSSSQSLFQLSPFNYQTLKSKLDKFSASCGDTRDDTFYEQLVLDAVASCRALDKQSGKSKVSTIQCEDRTVESLLSSSEKTNGKACSAELLLENFLLRNRNPQINAVLVNKSDRIVKSYLLTEPVPNSDQILNTVVELNNKNRYDDSLVVSEDNIKVAVRAMLNNEKNVPVVNFQNAFRLIEQTLGSARYIDSVKQKTLTKYIPGYFAGFASIELAAGALFDRFAVEFVGASMASTTGLKLMLGSYLFNVSLLGILAALGFFGSKTMRIKWRPGVNLWHKFVHHKELTNYEKIFIHYEELYDLNVNNYHLIGGNREKIDQVTPAISQKTDKDIDGLKSLLNYTDANNQQVSYEFPSLDFEPTAKNELNYQILSEKRQLLNFFREKLREKRMLIEEYTEPELLFQEYWASNGENFEWVEPDQDPAELKLLQKHRVYN